MNRILFKRIDRMESDFTKMMQRFFRVNSWLVLAVLTLNLVIFAVDPPKAKPNETVPMEQMIQQPYPEKLYNLAVMGKPSQWNTLNSHDPSVFKDGDTYYVFSTDASLGGVARPGIQVKKSTDLISWKTLKQAFDGVPAAAKAWSDATGLWAPDVIKIGTDYYLYYCASKFGTNRSFIGVAKSKNIEGPWEDQGEVIKTDLGDPVNAIDPHVSFDTSGNLWMCYGSFWSGISIIRLDKTTGKPLKTTSEKRFGKLIASRHITFQGAVEGPYIIYNPVFQKYYLFVSYGSLFYDYNVRVGRSDKIDGPYLDINGLLLTDTTAEPDEVGNKVLGSYKFGQAGGWIAPGHNSVLNDHGNFYLFHHARGDKDKNWFYLHVRKILWSGDGWPLVSPERYAGEKEQKIAAKVIPGTWEKIVLMRTDNDQIQSQPLILASDGAVKDASGKSSWRLTGDNVLTLHLYNSWLKKVITYESKVIPAWDWENQKSTYVFTGIDQQGVAIWGKKVD